MSQYGFYIDLVKCTGCKTCVIACKDAHSLPVGTNYRKVIEFVEGDWKKDANGAWLQDVRGYYVPIACNECADPAVSRFARQRHISSVNRMESF